jgi:hypothetical protein
LEWGGGRGYDFWTFRPAKTRVFLILDTYIPYVRKGEFYFA